MIKTITIIALLISTSAHASITEGGRGMLFGEDHAFSISAISGWILDNESGVSQGLHMLFYPKGKTWSNSPVIIYGRSISTFVTKNPKLQVKRTIQDFHKNGSPNYSAKVQTSISLSNGKQATIYHFTGDKWDNYEAVAYFQEKDTINYLVFNSRSKNDFVKFLEEYYKIVSSYKNLYVSPSTNSNDKLKLLKDESVAILVKPGGKKYESNATKAIVQSIASTMKICTSYLKNENLPAFSYFVRIDKDGRVNESLINPTNALSTCFSGMMSSEKYPIHTFESFVLNIEMKVSE